MKILIGHMASSTAFPRLLEALKWQSLFGWPESVDRVLVTEKPENTISGVTTIVEEAGERHGLFNLSKMRNRLLDHAVAGSFDGLMIMEADFVALRWWTKFPETWAVPFAVYDSQSVFTFPEISSAKFVPVHCLMLNRSVFNKVRWDETYQGVGYDDLDFNNQMTGTVGPFEHTDAILLHRWHPSMKAQVNPVNKAYYESRWKRK